MQHHTKLPATNQDIICKFVRFSFFLFWNNLDGATKNL